GDNSYYGTALAGGISGTTISYGPACQFNDATGNWMLVTCLDNIHFSIAYKDDSNANYGTAIVGARSGNILTFGSKTVYNSAATQYISVAGINDTKFVVSYQDNNAYGRAIIGEMEHPTIEVAGGTSYDGTYTFVDAYNSKNRYRDSSGNEIRYESGVGTGQWQLVSSARAIIYTNYYECGGGYVVKPPNSGWQGSIPLPSLSGDVCTSLANDATTEVPTDYIILNVYPNPFNSKISIEYTLPSREKVDISVYDIKGQFISEIFEGVQNAGSHKLIWDCTYHSSGIYFLSLSTGGNTAMQKVMLIK
ncbi:MAG: T9SS type A sorting domain-containing protein, partial [Candidatus Marinimicrobia bacterium]|nr:T9SS type A sorting domain-containing protein [Candidatus Neomarinimicrobiota bacterium]